MFKRIFLFVIVNLLVLVTISIVTSLLGVNHYLTAHGINYQALMGFCLVWGFGGAFISLGLSRIIAKFAMGVRVIDPNNCTSDERSLYDTIAVLARKAQLPKMPEVGIYESPDLNAFATGPSKRRSLVAVSTGLLHRMNRAEVEGVLAHEVTHIANGDMVTMTLLQGIINAFVMFFARVIAFSVTQFVKEDMRPLLNMVVVIVLEILLSLLGMLVVAAFSRYREFRADDGGARLSSKRNMIAALEALQRAYERTVNNEHAPKAAESVAAFRISNKRSLFALLATHPPLETRIATLREKSNIL